MNQNTISLNVYFNRVFCGKLSKSINDLSSQYSFEYNNDYISSNSAIPIALNFPLVEKKFISINGLHPFFDNLVSEGWLRKKHDEYLNAENIFEKDKFIILSYFGYDLIGSISIDNSNSTIPRYSYSLSSDEDKYNSVKSISIESNASISGVQKKLVVIEIKPDEFQITKANQLSTHIAKLEATEYPELIELEYLSSLAVKYLLPDDEICNLQITNLDELKEKALLIKRFDRYLVNYKKKTKLQTKHFEELNQLFKNKSENKYDLSYDAMAKFIYETNECSKSDVIKLFKRILAYILIGNTDAHLKNFGMFHNQDGSLTLTPMYDVVASAYYAQFNTLALEMNGKKNLELNRIKPKDIVDFAFNKKGFDLSAEQLIEVVNSLKANKGIAISKLKELKEFENFRKVKEKLVDMINKRWNGSFNGIEEYLKKKK